MDGPWLNPDHEDVVGLTEAQVWERVDDNTFDEDLLCEPAQVRPRPEIERLLRRTWPSWPTLVHEVAEAREGLDTLECIGLAVRHRRRALGLSQRALADLLGETQSTTARLERRPGGLAVGRLVEMLERIGCGLTVTVEGAVLDATSWPASDLVARDAAGRRLPAHGAVERVIGPYRHEGRADGQPPLWRWRRIC